MIFPASTLLRRLALLLPACLVLAVVVALSGCVNYLTPPRQVADPITVVLIDYGHHAGLLLPRRDGSRVEYAWGEWKWFALNQDQWQRVPMVMLWPTDSTLGRRTFPAPADLERLRGDIPAEAWLPMQVSAARSEQLLADLDRQFQAGRHTLQHNDRYGMDFVRQQEPYWLLNNCNHAAARAMMALGVDVEGNAILSQWVVQD